ncbi:hypothetical protein M5689_001679 [Euphorbia peplus]|nr:hypothetical protein M5689_001679 [Euphorbia peplus]
MWRKIDTHLKTIRLPIRTVLTPSSNPIHTLPNLNPNPKHFSHFKTLTFTSISPFLNPNGRSPHPHLSGSSNLGVVMCIWSIFSTSTPPYNRADWNEPLPDCEIGDAGSRSPEEDDRVSIPVRAYFFSTSVDLKSLVEQNKGPGTCISGSNSSYMVVFQYGSIVVFNVTENQVDDDLSIVRNHASGLLPEMRKDAEILLILISMQ